MTPAEHISDEKLDEVRQWVDRWGSPSNVRLDLLSLLTELQHRRAEGAGTPEGWVLVPREPTEAMIAAGAGAVAADHGADLDPSAEADTALAYRAMLAASPSSSPSPAWVKALEWKAGNRHKYKSFDGVMHEADAVGGRYAVWHYMERAGQQFVWHGTHQWFDTLDDAKAACQADYEARIRSALGEQP